MATEKKPIDQTMIDVVSGKIKNTLSVWFGPLEPLKPMVSEEQKPSVIGRQFDFPVGQNLQSKPRSTDAVSFAQLRGLAEACDVLRIVIETRKDQMSKMMWKIRPVDKKLKPDSRCEDIQEFFKKPDREHDWDTWLRMLLEDLFVIDAPTLYIRPTKGGQAGVSGGMAGIYSFDPMDGSTIKRVITAQGRTPEAPLEAYQQILKGLPAVGYTTDELIYMPRNVRTAKMYGYSPVEQIIMTVNIALRRSIHKLQYYTEGNVPEAIVGTPADWNPDQIAIFQKHWDSLNEGNTAERRHMKFVPGKLDVVMVKEEVLKDTFDEWLARVVCFCFSIEPTAFVHQQNRATAESAREAALTEGLAPIQKWVVNMMNDIIQNRFGFKDLCFDWADEEVQSPMERAQINDIYVKNGVVTTDEVRADLGKDPLTPEQKADILAAKAPPPLAIQPGDENTGGGGAGVNPPPKPGAPPAPKPSVPKTPGEAAASTGKLEKAKKVVPGHIDYDRASIVKMRVKLGAFLAKFLKKQGKIVAGRVGKVEKGTPVDQIDWDSLVPDVGVMLAVTAADGAAVGLESVGVDKAVPDGPVTSWAMDRAAEMVGKTWKDGIQGGELIDNPKAEWVITDSTREMIQSMVADATDQGLTTDELASMIEDSFAFSEERASMIARTEVAMANQAGQMIGYVESGVVAGTEWTTAEDDLVSDDCVANAEAGVIPLGELYPSGDEAPPAHPNCFISGTKISAIGVSAHYKRWFSGMIAIISGSGIDDISVTPNHPILTRHGWVAAGELKIGDELVQCIDPRAALSGEPYNNYVESSIENVACSLRMAGSVLATTMPTSAIDFHGDGIPDSEVHVVRAYSSLAHDGFCAFHEIEQGEFADGISDVAGIILDANRTPALLINSHDPSANSIMCGGGQSGSILGAGFRHTQEHGVASGSDAQTVPSEILAEDAAMASDAPSYINARLAGHISFVKITNLSFSEFRGHVYNLETRNGWYVANGIIAHNCRCAIIASLIPEE